MLQNIKRAAKHSETNTSLAMTWYEIGECLLAMN